MKFNIIPLKGTDILKLGLTSEENQSILKITPKIVEQSNRPDAEDYGICSIDYDSDGKSIAIEFKGEDELIFHDINLLGAKPRKVKRLFKKLDPDIIDEDDEGFVSLKLSIGITIDEGIVTGVLVGKEGYLDFWLHPDSLLDKLNPAVKEFHFIPYVGSREVKFGLTPEENRYIFKIEPNLRPELILDDEELKHVPCPEDYGVCFMYYNRKGKSCYIEFKKQAKFFYNDKDIFDMSIDEVYKELKKIDPDAYCDGYVGNDKMISPKYSLKISPCNGGVIMIGVGEKDCFKKIV